jgi:hypothetical protein
MRDSLARRVEAESVEEMAEVEIQRLGFQTEGEGKVEGFVCMPWMLRDISVLGGTIMVVVWCGESGVGELRVRGVEEEKGARGIMGTGP